MISEVIRNGINLRSSLAHGDENITMGQLILNGLKAIIRCNVRLQFNYFNLNLCNRILLQSVILSSIFYFSEASAALKLEKLDDSIYAYVGEQIISADDYRQTLQNAVKGKFYHGKIPAGQMEEVQRDAGKGLIVNMMLLQEAQRRNYKPDPEFIKTSLEEILNKYEKQYGNSDKWPEYRARFIPRIKKHLAQKSIVKQLENEVSKVPSASIEDSQQYYNDNKDKFTSPEQLRVFVILLQVMPSSPVAVWDEAMDEGRRIFKQLQNGADFSELAKLHSADASAKDGGDMGYLHKGMLAKKIQDTLDEMKPGETSRPIEVLKGIVIFRLQDRIDPVLNPFEKVKDRAGRLWQREQVELAKKNLVDSLWLSTPVIVNSKYYQDDDEKLAAKVKK